MEIRDVSEEKIGSMRYDASGLLVSGTYILELEDALMLQGLYCLLGPRSLPSSKIQVNRHNMGGWRDSHVVFHRDVIGHNICLPTPNAAMLSQDTQQLQPIHYVSQNF